MQPMQLHGRIHTYIQYYIHIYIYKKSVWNIYVRVCMYLTVNTKYVVYTSKCVQFNVEQK